MQNLKLEDEHGSTKGYFSQGNKKISWNEHQVFPERKYKRTWKSKFDEYVVTKQKINIYCCMQIIYSCQFSPYLVEKYPPQILKKMLCPVTTFSTVISECSRIEGSLKILGFHLIQDRKVDFLRNIHFSFLNNLTVSVVRCFRERFFYIL